jgi:CspA family cold shock protein
LQRVRPAAAVCYLQRNVFIKRGAHRLDSSHSHEAIASLFSQFRPRDIGFAELHRRQTLDVGIGPVVGYVKPLNFWRPSMARGTVKWSNPTKGYGFIPPQGGGKDVFVHISAVEKAGLTSLNDGQSIEYEEVSNRGKTSAENLKVQR